ncbi:15309_t:CDS:2, partial [Gigaspora rosea]
MNLGFYKALDYRSEIRAVFELKKDVLESHIHQAIAELIVANIVSNYAVFMVFTDLNKAWLFYWFTNDKQVVMSQIETSGEAITIIERALVRSSIATTTTTTVDPNFLIEMRPKVKFDFDDDNDIANMKDMFDDMTEKEITGWKVRRALRLLQNTPGFQLDKDYVD